MDNHTVDVLEFDKILSELRRYCLSGTGAETLESQAFFVSAGEAERFIDMVEDFYRLLASGKHLPSLLFPPIEAFIRRIRKPGSVLETGAFADIRSFIHSAEKLKRYLTAQPENQLSFEKAKNTPVLPKDSLLYTEAEKIPGIPKLLSEINKIITEDGQINDKIPALRAIRRRIQEINREIEAAASKLINTPEYGQYWQNNVAGQKDGRTVLPVKSQYKNRIQGLVQEVSASGATVYIEPYEFVEKNNELAYEKSKYEQEKHRILLQLTDTAREYAEALTVCFEQIGFIDTVCSRARFAVLHDCRRAGRGAETLTLVRARHPLLGKTAVPIFITLEKGTKVLVVSGPNTGGKTVALKTVGLLSLMRQFGMMIPAGEESVLPVFSNIFADIGDEQSIDLSLSTFSGHMRRISSIAADANENALVLLDELGSGTDSREGGAIAMAVMDHLYAIGCKTIVTTHQTALKHYAFTKQFAENASVEFDITSMRPSYRIISGVPGESHALKIAELVGMNRNILERAEQYAGNSQSDIAEMIEEVIRKGRELNSRLAEVAEKERAVERKKEDVKKRESEIEEKWLSVKQGGISEMREFLDESRSRLENLVRELREGEISRQKIKKSKSFVGEIEEKLKDEKQVVQRSSKRDMRKDSRATAVRAGLKVRVGKHRREGTVLRKNKDGTWEVAVGTMRLHVQQEDLYSAPPESGNNAFVPVEISADTEPAKLHLDIRGMRYEEAVQTLRNQIDRAFLSGLREFEIIHGKGEGVLQQAVHDVLSMTEGVEEFYFARPELGGFGKTVVKLAKK